MITFNIKDFLNNITKDRKLLAIDLGLARIGISFSDVEQKIAVSSLMYKVKDQQQSLDTIASNYIKEKCCGVVIGMPFTHTRSNNWIEYITEFANKLCILLEKAPIYFQDESNSTQNANFIIKNFSRKRKKAHKDKLAACCILQEALDIISLYRKNS